MSKPLHPIERFLIRYNLVTFIVLAALSLAFIVYLCYNTYTTATTPSSTAEQGTMPTSFDKETAESINKLHTPDQAPDPSLPSNVRINPFVE